MLPNLFAVYRHYKQWGWGKGWGEEGEYLYPEMENDYCRIKIVSFNVLDKTMPQVMDKSKSKKGFIIKRICFI